MNIPEFVAAVEGEIEREQAATALRIVNQDLDELTTAKERGRWQALLDARNILHACIQALTADPAAESAPPEAKEMY